MDAKELRELIDIISRSDFASFELERKDFKLKLVKSNSAPSGVQVVAVPEVKGTLPSPPREAPAATPVAEAEAAAESGLVDLKSPIVGTFYRAPSPGAPPFVSVGDGVKKGQVVCIVEAMKLMNEIEADIEGSVVEIVAENGQPVEYGDVLFRLRPVA